MKKSIAVILFSLVLSIFPSFLTGCRHSLDNNHLTCVDFALHLKNRGIHVETLQPLETLFNSSEALAIGIAGKEIGVYKYNINIPVQAQMLESNRKLGYIYFNAQKYPALFNGTFMFIFWESNPKKEEIIKAINSF